MGPNWAKSTKEAYDPQGSGMDNDLPEAPGVQNSGNMKYKWDVPGNHSNGIEPPSNLHTKGD